MCCFSQLTPMQLVQIDTEGKKEYEWEVCFVKPQQPKLQRRFSNTKSCPLQHTGTANNGKA